MFGSISSAEALEAASRAGALIRDLPTLLARRMDRWSRDQHGPFDIAGDGSIAWCRVCKVDWPCDDFVRLDERLTEVTS